MGLKTGHKDVSFSIKNVSIEALIRIGKVRMKSYRNNNSDNSSTNIVLDIDASYVLRSINANDSNRDPVSYLIQLSMILASLKIDVVIVCDGASRHHSKRSTTKRAADCHRNLVSLQHDQSKLLHLRHIIDNDSNHSTNDSHQELIKQRDLACKKIKSKEKSLEKSNIDVGEESYQQIRKLVREIDVKNEKKKEGEVKGTIKLMRATFQADSVLAYRIASGQSDIMLCPDSDMLVLTGKKCLCIKSFKFNYKSKKPIVSCIELFFASEETLIEINRCTYIDPDHVLKPKYPIFARTDDIRLRSLMSIGIGCDVLLNGVPSITPKTLHEMLDGICNTNQDATYNTYDWIFNGYVERWKKKNNISNESDILEYKMMLNVLVDSIVYEPCHTDDSDNPLYLHRQPPFLHQYVAAFACNNNNIMIIPTTIDCCYDMFLCVGPGKHSHHVFKQEHKIRECDYCQSKICMTCTFTNKDDENVYCVRCFSQETSIINTTEKKSTYLPLNKMINELKQRGMLLNNNEDYDFILDIYQAMQSQNTMFDEKDFVQVMFPIETSTYLNIMDIIAPFNIIDGGSFLRRDDIEFATKIEILKILVSVVTEIKTDDDININNSTYSLFSNTMIDFANNARVHDGQRLLKRAIRHALDHDAVDIISATGNIVSYNSKTAIYLKHRCKASMKSDTYDTEILFNRESIIACSCTCRCGSIGIERILCVHILPIIYQLVMLMYTGLAKDILYELDIAFHNKKHTINDKNDLRNIIQSLFYIIKYNNDNKYMSQNIDEMLYDFRVGTDKPKFGPGPPYDPSKIGPISELDLRSVRKRAKDIITADGMSTNNMLATNNNDQSVIATTKTVDKNTYTKIVMCIIAACNIARISKEERQKYLDSAIGFRLLLHRSSCVSWNSKVSKQIVKDMKNLLLEGSQKQRKSKYINNKNKKKIKERTIISANKKSKLKYKMNLARTCCACSRTGTLYPNIKFRSVPRTPQHNINAFSNNKKILLVAKKKKKRNIILDRLGIKGERRNCDDLRFCDIHEYVNEYITVDWIDKDGKEKMNRFKLQVVKEYNNSEQQVDCSNLYNNNNSTPYHLRRDKSFKGIIMINEGEVVQVHHHYDKASNDEMNNVSIKYHKNDRKHRKAVVRTNNENDSDDDDDTVEDDSDDDSTYDGNNDYDMMDNHLLTYDDNYNDNIINNNGQENNIENNNNGLEDDLYFDHNMTDNVPNKKRKTKTICNYYGCNNTNDDTSISFKIIPCCQHETHTSTNRNNARKHYEIKKAFRRECLKRIGVDDHELDHQQPIRICNQHEVKQEYMMVKWSNNKGKKTKEKVSVNLPVQYIPSFKSTSTRPNKGCGKNRWVLNQLRIANDNKENSQDLVNRNEMLNLQRVHGLENNDEDNKHISAVVSNEIGLYNIIHQNNVPIKINDNEITDNNNYDYLKNKYTTKMRILDLLKANTLSCKTIKIRTGFNSALELLSFIIIICHGDIATMKQNITSISWFEEWCLYCGVAMSKNISRWCDAEDKYHVSERTCRRIFDSKQKTVLETRLSWPRYVSYDEDHYFRKRKKDDDNYDNMRIVMWDNTDITLLKPSSGEAQRLTWSAYYAANVAKGGVFVQLCNWTGTHPLWTGAVTDTEYLVKSGVLEQQLEYIQQYDHARSPEIAWTNVLDRGYKVTQQAWSTGNQQVLQPINAPTGRRFNTTETLFAAGVANVRAPNEQAVKRVKTSSYLSHGQRANESVERLNDMWLSYGFMINFMGE